MPWGSFGLGVFSILGKRHEARLPEWLRLGTATGFFGSFTTFSAFSAEAYQLLRQHMWLEWIVFVALNLFGGIVLAWSGIQLAKRVGERREMR